MSGKNNEASWHQLTQEVMSGMREWRLKHRQATLRDIETELDTRLNRMRACMLEDLALARSAADWTDAPQGERPDCPDCHQPLQLRGTDTRTLQTHGGQSLTLTRQHGTCPAGGAGFFPPR